MPKFYLSKSNDDQTALSSEYAITLNGSQVKFFKNNSNIKNLSGGSYSQPVQSLSAFTQLGNAFTKYFSGDNAFAYMRSNANNLTDNSGLSW